jgi:hypothetical protein
MFSEKPDLLFDNPDIALFRAGTAVAATGTLKMQSILIPFIFGLQSLVLSLLKF